MTKVKNQIANVQTPEVVKTKKVRAQKVIVAEVPVIVAEVTAIIAETKKKRKSEKRKLFLIEGILYNVSTKKLSAGKLIFKNDEAALKAYLIANSQKINFTKNLFLTEGILYKVSNRKLSAAKLVFKNDEVALQASILENSKEVKFSEKF